MTTKSVAAWGLAATILLLTAFLRLYHLSSVPPFLYIDEVAMLVEVTALRQTGTDLHGSAWYSPIYFSYGDFKLPVYIWLATLLSFVFSVSEWTLKLPSVLAGIGTVLVAGLIAKEFYQRDAAGRKATIWGIANSTWVFLATAFVVAISPWSIIFSRAAFEGHVAQFFVSLSVYFALLGLKKNRWLWLAAGLGAVATYTYFSVRFVWPVIFVALTVTALPLEPKRALKHLIVNICLPLIVFCLLLIPMYRSEHYGASNDFRLGTDSVLKNDELAHIANQNILLAGNTAFKRVLFHRYWLTARELLKNYSDHLSIDYLFLSGDPNWRHGTQRHGLFLLPFLPLLVLGLFSTFNKRKGVFFVLVVWWAAALLPASVPQDTPHALRSLNALTPLSVFIGFGTLFVLGRLKKWWRGVALATIVATSLFFTFEFSYYYFTLYPKESAHYWFEGKKELAQKLLAIDAGKKPIYIFAVDDKFYLWLYAYGDFGALKNAPQEGRIPHLTRLGNFYVKYFTFWPNYQPRVILATTPGELEKVMQAEGGKIVSQQTIYSSSGEPLYLIVELQR